MIILRNFSKINSIKNALIANKSATGIANKRLANLGKKAAKEMTGITGKSSNVTTGKNGSFLKQYHYEFQKRVDVKRPKIKQPELPGFGRGETRGPLLTDPKIRTISRSRKPWVRSEHHGQELPNQNIRTKKMFVNGSSRVTIDSPRIPGL